MGVLCTFVLAVSSSRPPKRKDKRKKTRIQIQIQTGTAINDRAIWVNDGSAPSLSASLVCALKSISTRLDRTWGLEDSSRIEESGLQRTNWNV